jgi:hypothetical protein
VYFNEFIDINGFVNLLPKGKKAIINPLRVQREPKKKKVLPKIKEVLPKIKRGFAKDSHFRKVWYFGLKKS